MAYTRTFPARTKTKQGVDEMGEDQSVVCTGHNRKASKRPTSKNPGRWFYCCPLPRDDPKRCNFFKWADQLGLSPAKNGRTMGTGNTLGRSPGALPGAGSRAAAIAMAGNAASSSATGLSTPQKNGKDSSLVSPSKAGATRTAAINVTDSDDEIDWGSVDADAIERDAELRVTPRTSQASPKDVSKDLTKSATSVASDLFRASLDAPKSNKRLREVNDAEERTPKRDKANPFLDGDDTAETPTRPSNPTTPSTAHTSVTSAFTPGGSAFHPALTPTLGAIEGLGEHLARQERLVRAADAMKKSMRATIANLQARVKELEEQLEVERQKNK